MAIVIAGIIGGAVVGVIAKESHSDYSASYSDYYERQREAEEEANRRRESYQNSRKEAARSKLDGIINLKVDSFENREKVTVKHRASTASCHFYDFKDDMKEMDKSAKSAIKEQVATTLREAANKKKSRLKELDSLIQAVNECMLNQKPAQKR